MSELERGRRYWRAGEYRAAHELWEEAWRQAPRNSRDNPLYRGLCQAAAAVIHAQHQRWRGVAKVGCKARDTLRTAGMNVLAEAIDRWARRCADGQAWVMPPPLD